MTTSNKKNMNTNTKVCDVPMELSILELNDEVDHDRRSILHNNIDVHVNQNAITCGDSEAIDHQQITREDVEINHDSSRTRNRLHPTKDINHISIDSMKKNPRVVDNTNKESNVTMTTNIINSNKADYVPIVGYAMEPLLPLAKACAPLANVLHDIFFYVQIAINETPEVPPDGLSVDESAAIRLYTMEWKNPHRSLYSMLNYTLNDNNREHLRPYFKYLKLFLTALAKLPCVPQTAVWRGVTTQ